MAKTDLGLEENIEALLAYVLGFITGIVFLLIEKKNQFVRFHAMQSTILFLGLWVISFVLAYIPILGWIADFLLQILGLILWILLMVKAYQGEKYKVPFVGDIAEKQLSKK
ncbi:DUF4870 domain-containing protein [Candidatus Woesearchaeota archaeon]|nr:MAG: DUF4870 domain-containing protein [Candidatus Woesearchaeota archaeon]